MPLSFNTASRVSRQGGQDPIYYKITDTTHIAKVPMKRFLSYVNTKMEVTQYIARKTLERGHQSEKDVAVDGATNVKQPTKMWHTKMLLHAIDATTSEATSIDIISPDTDVYVFSLRRFPELCENTFYVTGRGQRHHKTLPSPIVLALGPARTAALHGFHAWSGADITGSFAGIGKLAT